MNSFRSLQTLRYAAVLMLASAGPLYAGEVAVPTFAQSITPAEIGPDNISTVTFLIDNSTTDSPVDDFAFVNTLPGDMRIADLPNLKSDCAATIEAESGADMIIVSGGQLGIGQSCQVQINLTAASTQNNITGDLTSSLGNSGSSSAVLTVDPARPEFSKQFSPPTVSIQTISTLVYEIDNTLSETSHDFLTFIDDLPGGLEVAGNGNVSTSCEGGDFPAEVTADPGATQIQFRTGFVASGAACTIEVDVVPTIAGRFVSVSDSMTTVVPGFPPISIGKSAAVLQATRGFLNKAFTDDPVAPGGVVALEFSLSNFSRVEPVSNIVFSDDLGAMLTGASVSGSLPENPCGPDSSLTGSSVLSFSGSLDPEQTCTFEIDVSIPASASAGEYDNTTSTVMGTVGGDAAIFAAAQDTLIVQTTPQFTKSFGDIAVAGGQVTLTFDITNTSSSSELSEITFDDDLSAMLDGTVVDLPGGGFCGPSSFLAMTGNDAQILTMLNGSLPAQQNCQFDVVLTIPATASGGTYINITEPLSGQIDGTTILAAPAEATLTLLSAPDLTMTFGDMPPALPGGEVEVRFELALGPNAIAPATSIGFTYDLSATLAGLQVAQSSLDPACGSGASFDGSTVLVFSDGALEPGTSCSLTAMLSVPAGATTGTYNADTSAVTARSQGLDTASPPAESNLTIAAIEFTKMFKNGPAVPGGEINVEYLIRNASPATNAANIAFIDDLGATLPGLSSISASSADICGNGSLLTGNAPLTFSGGSLAAGESCTFSATLAIPGNADIGEYAAPTSALTADLGGPINVPGASDDLIVSSQLALQKQFTPATSLPGLSVDLQFTVSNLGTASTLSSVSFSDDLDAMLTGALAVGLPAIDVCGPGSSLTGSSMLVLTNGSLPAGASCEFVVTIQLPSSAIPGAYENITSAITAANAAGEPARASLTILEPPTDLAIGMTNGTDAVGDNTIVRYVVAIMNTGQTNNSGAQVSVVIPAELTQVVWVCIPESASAACTDNGTGAIADSISLPVGERIEYELEGLIVAGQSDELAVTASVMAIRDENSANDAVTDTDVIDPGLVFRAGFETQESLIVEF